MLKIGDLPILCHIIMKYYSSLNNKMSKENKLADFKHNGFWQCMDTQRDKLFLEKVWHSGDAAWELW
jgi:NDP-sugar pyrophosphorylase family protein